MFTAVKVRLVMSLLLLLGLAYATQAQGNRRNDNQQSGRWAYLGEANVDGNADHDFIRVGRAEGRFQSLQIRVDRAPIEFQRVIVHFANGNNEEITIRDRIPNGGQTRAIDLRGNDRAITGVEFWYSKGTWRSRMPRVRLYGR